MSNESEKYPEMDYFMNESLSDVIFVIEGQPFPALKSILSLKSKVFRDIFSENFKEVSDNKMVIEDTTFEAFKTFIRFLYCDQLILSNENDLKLIEDIYKLSVKYNIFRLKERIIKILLDFKFDFNLWEEIYKIALKYEIKELVEKVMSFMEKSIHFIGEDNNNRFMEMFANIYSKISYKNMESVIKLARDESDNYEVEEQYVWNSDRRESYIQSCQRAIRSSNDHATIAKTIANDLQEIYWDITFQTVVWEQNYGSSFRVYHPKNECYFRIRFGRLIIEIFTSKV